MEKVLEEVTLIRYIDIKTGELLPFETKWQAMEKIAQRDKVKNFIEKEGGIYTNKEKGER